MEEESLQELFNRYGDQTLLVFVSRIPPAKRGLASGQGNLPVVRYGDPVGVSPEIEKNMARAAEGPLRIHHPIVTKELPEPGREDLGLSQQLQGSMKTELAFLKGPLQSLDKLAPKDPAQSWRIPSLSSLLASMVRVSPVLLFLIVLPAFISEAPSTEREARDPVQTALAARQS